MNFRFNHNNINVLNLEKSIKFYEENLGLNIIRQSEATDKSFKLVFMGDGTSTHLLELTWLTEWERPYNLGDNEIHLAFCVDDFDAAYELHKENNCICYENKAMGVYFIEDPDGYWVEIIPAR